MVHSEQSTPVARKRICKGLELIKYPADKYPWLHFEHVGGHGAFASGETYTHPNISNMIGKWAESKLNQNDDELVKEIYENDVSIGFCGHDIPKFAVRNLINFIRERL